MSAGGGGAGADASGSSSISSGASSGGASCLVRTKMAPPSPRQTRSESSRYVVRSHVSCWRLASIAKLRSPPSGVCSLSAEETVASVLWSWRCTGSSAASSGARSTACPITSSSFGSASAMSFTSVGTATAPLTKRTSSRFGERTSTAAEALTADFMSGAVNSTLFSTVIDSASMDCVMAPISSSGSRPAASSKKISELDVYASSHVPDKSSKASAGLSVGFPASS
mmetsp:Transcript_17198/g.56306  ORF Transcript_17198/g.56306 Transcript_17198/m.56306 type:complete len:226 (+) Transcript_17198:161-838(+)